MDSIIEPSGVMNGRNGKFTTHCFRGGGAQYHFMWANRKWSLKAVKWWGGWSSNENVRILNYELAIAHVKFIGWNHNVLPSGQTHGVQGFGDILMGDRTSECHETFMGHGIFQHLSQGVTSLSSRLSSFSRWGNL
jgi:hypothetical protein